jgi:hypothetical protein
VCFRIGLINWIRLRPIPPAIIDAEENFVSSMDDFYDMEDDHKYKFDVRFDRVRFRPGWSREYLDFDYTVDSEGSSVQQASARIEVRTSRLFRQGY